MISGPSCCDPINCIKKSIGPNISTVTKPEDCLHTKGCVYNDETAECAEAEVCTEVRMEYIEETK